LEHAPAAAIDADQQPQPKHHRHRHRRHHSNDNHSSNNNNGNDLWVNVVLARIRRCLDVHIIEALLLSIINAKLARLHLAWLGELVIREIEVGEALPAIRSIQSNAEGGGANTLDVAFAYSNGMRLMLDLTVVVNVPSPKFGSIKIAISACIYRLSGRLRVVIDDCEGTGACLCSECDGGGRNLQMSLRFVEMPAIDVKMSSIAGVDAPHPLVDSTVLHKLIVDSLKTLVYDMMVEKKQFYKYSGGGGNNNT
jgi:hypothetical protein